MLRLLLDKFRFGQIFLERDLGSLTPPKQPLLLYQTYHICPPQSNSAKKSILKIPFESIEIELAGRRGGGSQASNYFLIDRTVCNHFLGAGGLPQNIIEGALDFGHQEVIGEGISMETRILEFLTPLTLSLPRVINTLSMNFYSMPKVLKRRAWVSEERHVLARGRKSPIWDIYAPAHRRPNRHSRDSQTSLLFQYK